MARLRARLVFPGDERPGPSAVLRVRVEDARIADRRSVLVDEAALPITVSPKGEMPFSVELGPETLSPGSSMRVHVDGNGDGRIKPGDWTSYQQHEIRAGEELVIPLETVI